MNEPLFSYRQMAADTILQHVDAPIDDASEDGIVICAGGPTYFVQAYVLLRLLRHLGCRLPIELWYRGPAEMPPQMQQLVEPLDIRLVDAMEICRRNGVEELQGWAIKPFAMLHSRFRRVLYLDSDNVPVDDPTYLFDAPEFRNFGSLFWTDRHRGGETRYGTIHPDAWSAFNVPLANEPEFESGQVLVDRKIVQRELALTLHFNQQAEFYYQFVYGDKDTFRFAWNRLGRKYATVPFGPSSPPNYGVLYQHDPDGRIIFQHRARTKWDLHQKNRVVPGFRHGPLCVSILHELRRSWADVIAEWKDGSSAIEREHAVRLIDRTDLKCSASPTQEAAIRFRSNGTIESKLQMLPRYWQLAEQPNGTVTLNLIGGEAAPIRLRWSGSYWTGVRVSGERHRVVIYSGSKPSTKSLTLAYPIHRHASVRSSYDLSPAPEFRSFDPYPSSNETHPAAFTYQSEDAYPSSRRALLSTPYPNSPLAERKQASPVARGRSGVADSSAYPEQTRLRLNVDPDSDEAYQRQTPWRVRLEGGELYEPYAGDSLYQATSDHSYASRSAPRAGRKKQRQVARAVKIYGLPRTCTNLAAVLLRKNFDVAVYANELGWKHGPNLMWCGDKVKGERLVYVFCTRHPYAWLVSAYRFEIGSGFQHRSFSDFVLGTSQVYPNQNPVDVYNVLNRVWLRMAVSRHRIYHLRSESLQQCQRGAMQQIGKTLHLASAGGDFRSVRERIGPDETVRQQDFDPSWYRRKQYLEFFDDRLLRDVNARLDTDLVGDLGYQLSTV
ncbi:hypothetical protein [Rosistilla oblonga]|uniref:hypothetical protein n=1 Tax=Rosistilla oblonga TaxID=2527990 RepID=UPI003A98196A